MKSDMLHTTGSWIATDRYALCGESKKYMIANQEELDQSGDFWPVMVREYVRGGDSQWRYHPVNDDDDEVDSHLVQKEDPDCYYVSIASTGRVIVRRCGILQDYPPDTPLEDAVLDFEFTFFQFINSLIEKDPVLKSRKFLIDAGMMP